jgi:ubiquinone/menaquinone biosynthesis C-methylase UbiE
MTRQNASQQASSWDSRAAAYEESNAATSDTYARQALNIVGVTPGQKVLDVAAGPGYFSILAAQAGADVLAVDFAQGMVDYLREKVRRLDVENLRVEVMDGQDLKLEDDSFDIAYSSLGIVLFPDRAAGMREFCRVLKPGGLGAIVAFTGLEGHGTYRLVLDALEMTKPDFERVVPDPRFSLTDPDIFRTEMLTAGFSRVNMFTVRIVQTFDSPETFWPLLTDSPAIAHVFNDMTEDQVQAFGDIFAELVRSRQGDGPYGTENEVRIAVGVK